MKENWIKIENSKGYWVSNLGNLKKEESIIWCEYNKSYSTLKERLYNEIKPAKNGYCRFTIRYLDNTKRMETIHIFVAKFFIPNPDNKPYVNHKNGIKHDNRAENLEWVTHQENMDHRFKVLKNFGHRRGNKSHLAVLTEEQVRFIPNLLERGFSIRNIGKIMNVSANTIGEITQGRSWQHLELFKIQDRWNTVHKKAIEP
jgi:hypothetical protein